MPNDDPKANGQTPKLHMPEQMHFERGPVICRNCKRRFEHFVIEVIDDLTQLRCGDVLIASIRMACMHCGRVFTWDVNTKKLEDVAVKYGELSSKLPGYKPE
jgi:hypothetical protein